MEFRLLGPLEAVDDAGEVVALGGKRPRTLLAMLLLHPNEAVSTDRLIDAVWGEAAPTRAQATLQVHVHALRKALGADRIVTREPGYLVRVGPGELDVARFDDLVAAGSYREADALWRGRALADLGYEAFAQSEVTRLEERRLAAIEARIEADLDAGRHRELVAELEALVSAHPAREALQAQRILALYRSGRQTDALEAYRVARSALDELGLDPSPDLKALERRILEHDPSLNAPVAIDVALPGREETALVGRQLELAAISALLGRTEVRLVTLTGPGGSGKTRLAAFVAAGVPDAVFVDLSPLVDAELVLPTIAAALGLGDVSGRELEALGDELGERPRLLVLDNLEQVPGFFPSVGDLLAVAPSLSVLATSRVPLRIAAEHEYRVPPLPVPDVGADTVDEVETDAVRLYVARARAEMPEFELTETNASAIGRICRALDGLPLAIELAAARIRVLGPEGTAKRLGERLSLLTRSAPDLPARRRSLRAAIDWSYQLLDEDAQHVFRALAAFVGGATLDGVEAVAGAPTDVPTALETLLDASLVVHDSGRGGEPRFGMLETVREFALEELVASGEVTAARDAHLACFVRFVEEAWERSREEGQTLELMDDVEVERDNIRAALAWASQAEDPTMQLRLATSLRFFLAVRGPGDEARRIVRDALERRGSVAPELQGQILVSAGIHAMNDGAGEDGLRLLDEAIELFDAAGDRRGAAAAHANASTALSRLGDDAGAIARSELALEHLRAVGATAMVAQVLTNLARSHEQLGNYGQARSYLTEALDLSDPEAVSEGRAFTLAMLGYLAEREGDLDAAARRTAEAIGVEAKLRKDEYLGYAFVFAADLVLRRGDTRGAARLLGAADAAFTRAVVVPQTQEAERRDAVRARLEDELGSERGALEVEGAALELEAAANLATSCLGQV